MMVKWNGSFMWIVWISIVVIPGAFGERIGYIIPESVQTDMELPNLDLNDPEYPADREIAFELLAKLDLGIEEHVSRLEDQGHTVNLYGSQTDDSLGLDYILEHNDLIIISENPVSGDTGTFYVGADIPVMSQESFLQDEWGISSNNTDFDEDINARFFSVVKQHPITAGLPDEFAPLDTDPATGQPYIGNWTVLTNNAANNYPDNVLVRLVDGVPPFADPSEAGYTFSSEGDLSVVMAFDVGELNNNPARFVQLGFGSENVTGVNLADHELYADGSTSGIYCFNVMGDMGWQLVDQAVNWLLGIETDVANWSLY